MSAITDKHIDEEKHMGSQDYVESKDSRVEAAISAGNNLHRGLKNRHVAMISIGRLSLSFSLHTLIHRWCHRHRSLLGYC